MILTNSERQSVIFRLITTHLLLPVGLTAVSFYIQNDFYLINLMAQTVLLIVFLSGYWEFFGSRFRIFFLVFVETILLAQLIYRISFTIQPGHNLLLIWALSLIQVYLLTELVRIFIVMFAKHTISYEIQFPLRNGNFLITDGGNSRISRLMNYHFNSTIHKRNHTNNSMLFATDIVRIDESNKSFLPLANSEYAIFGDFVYSPINGKVLKVENTIPDNQPFSGNYPYNTGNTIVIRQNDLYLLIGHLQQGTIKVHPGQEVTVNQLIAQIGNSGMSERPHIHMQLMSSKSENYWRGLGICMQFRGKTLYKNRVIRN